MDYIGKEGGRKGINNEDDAAALTTPTHPTLPPYYFSFLDVSPFHIEIVLSFKKIN